MIHDAVIIGAGPSGLAAATRLSHFGKRVCVLEAHRRIGGLSSWHHVGGVEISSGLHAFTNYTPDGRGGPLGKLLRQLRLKYADLDLRPQGRSGIRFPSAALSFTNDPEFLRSQIAEVFPAAVDGFDRLRERIRATDEGELTLRQTSARMVLTECIADPLLIDMLLCPVMFYGNPGGVGDGRDGERDLPDMDWLLFCVVWKCIFESGFGYPARGMRPLWEALAGRIVENGGEVRLGSPVERLEIRNGKVAAAVLDSGEAVEGELYFSSAGGAETMAMLGENPLGRPIPAGSISIAEGIRILPRPASAVGMEDTTVFYSFEDRFRFRRPSGLVDDGSGVVCAPGNYDGVGENIIKVTQLASHPAWAGLPPHAYGPAKEAIGVGMSAALGRLGVVIPENGNGRGPGRFGGFDDLFTPLTLCRYTFHAEGALYGSPVKTRTGETGLDNLFLIGADQGFHGIVGAMLSGVAMANIHCLAKR